ncbi:MAG: NTP transferase domain-containing protein [Steroidobacteraceae bacterium]
MSIDAVYGLILTGGASKRMQRDKAALKYQGKTQLDRAYEILSRYLSRVFVSVRADQTSDPTRARWPMIVDLDEGEGPIVGIRSAFAAHPNVSWFVLACDLPFFSEALIHPLVRARDANGFATSLATAYKSAHEGLPEPLCAIWQPAAARVLAEYQAGGGHCPRKFLIRHGAHLVDLPDPRALDNVNTPKEYSQAVAALDTAPMQLKIHYYALMREQAGRSEETLETSAATPADLYTELAARYAFTLSREQLKVAVNSEFSDWSRKLAADDAVVFIPPVAGG